MSSPKPRLFTNRLAKASAGTYRWNRAESSIPTKKYGPVVSNTFAGTEDFLQKFDELDVNIDVLVACDSVLHDADKRSFFDNIRTIEPNIRIVIMFPGYRNQYIEDQITEYKNLYGVSDMGKCIFVTARIFHTH